MSTIVSRALSCGMRLIVERMSGVRSAGLSWVVPCGCAYDPVELQGRAAMWGELLMRGAGERSSREHADAMDRLGASRGTDVGTYTFRISTTALGSRVLDVLPLLVDMVRRPRMEEEAIEPCRDLALQALASLKDDPQERAMVLARSHHHPSPRDRSGLGTEEGLRALTRETLASGWRACCLPQGSVMSAAGDVDADELAARAEELLKGWTGEAKEPPVGATPARGYYHEPDSSSQVQVIVVHDGPREGDADSVLERLLMAVLSGGMSGRLFSEVREKRGLCYTVSAGYRGDRDYGVVQAYVGTTPERAQESLTVLLAELRRVHTPEGRVTPEEFERARTGMKSGLIFSGESTAARAAALASDYRRLGRARSLAEIAAQIDAVTLEQLNEYLGRRSMGRITIQTLGPVELKAPE